jgi:transposase
MSQRNLKKSQISKIERSQMETKSIELSSHLSVPPSVEKLLKENLPADSRPEYRRRLEIVLRANLGQSQAEICEALKCSEDTARYWMALAQTGQAYDRLHHPIGRPKTVNEEYLNRLRELVSRNPKDYGYSFQRWTAQWLGKHLSKEFDIEVSDRHINRLLKQMGLSTRSKIEGKPANSKPWCKGITIEDLYPPSSSQFPN